VLPYLAVPSAALVKRMSPVRVRPSALVSGLAPRVAAQSVFLFFSNRSGCLGSIAISLIGTLILLLVLGVFD
jgi:hypothetical protein